VALGEKLLAAQFMSIFTPKQLATCVVLSWPFCPDGNAVSEGCAGGGGGWVAVDCGGETGGLLHRRERHCAAATMMP
jgi:hypothetical protein